MFLLYVTFPLVFWLVVSAVSLVVFVTVCLLLCTSFSLFWLLDSAFIDSVLVLLHCLFNILFSVLVLVLLHLPFHQNKVLPKLVYFLLKLLFVYFCRQMIITQPNPKARNWPLKCTKHLFWYLSKHLNLCIVFNLVTAKENIFYNEYACLF